MRNKYCCQLPPDGRYTEWRDFEEDIKEPYILSIFFSKEFDKDKADEFWKRNFKQ